MSHFNGLQQFLPVAVKNVEKDLGNTIDTKYDAGGIQTDRELIA
jgi:hypothetical protein